MKIKKLNKNFTSSQNSFDCFQKNMNVKLKEKFQIKLFRGKNDEI